MPHTKQKPLLRTFKWYHSYHHYDQRSAHVNE